MRWHLRTSCVPLCHHVQRNKVAVPPSVPAGIGSGPRQEAPAKRNRGRIREGHAASWEKRTGNLVMAANKKKIFITETLSQPGRTILNARDDIETVAFPHFISPRLF